MKLFQLLIVVLFVFSCSDSKVDSGSDAAKVIASAGSLHAEEAAEQNIQKDEIEKAEKELPRNASVPEIDEPTAEKKPDFKETQKGEVEFKKEKPTEEHSAEQLKAKAERKRKRAEKRDGIHDGCQ